MTALSCVTRCDRCATPVEEPVTYADEICAPYADLGVGSCDHVPLCLECADLHTDEVIDEIEYAREHAGTFGYPDQVALTEIEQDRHGTAQSSMSENDADGGAHDGLDDC